MLEAVEQAERRGLVAEASDSMAGSGSGPLGGFLQLVEEVWSSLPSVISEDPRDPAPAMQGPEAKPGVVLIGRFEVGRELGKGGGGVVVLAFDPFLGRQVALKVPAPETLASLGSRERFLREARAVAALGHPNIVTIHEAGETGSIPYIAMEFCEVGSLADWLDSRRVAGRPVDARWAARLVVLIADGIQHAHDRGILHRDLKPSNILLQPAPNRPATPSEDVAGFRERRDQPDFVPKIADFGLAKKLDGDGPDADMTQQGIPLGTLPFMAAEAARGDGSSIGPPTDVYGLGVILYMLLTGRRPFVTTSRADLLHQVLHSVPRSPRDLRPGLPADLATICLKCLEKAPRDRYPNPHALSEDLRRFLDGRPILARPAPAWKRVSASVRRHPVRSAIVGLISAAVVAGLLGQSRLRDLERRGETRVLLRQLEATNVAGLPELVPQLDPSDRAVSERVGALFTGGNPTQRLAAALVLAGGSPEHGDYSFDHLLEADPADILPIARALSGRIPDLTARLAAVVAAVPRRGSPEAGVAHKRRANAGCALVGLGDAGRVWPLLRFTADPQTRSYLIHLLGPAGIDPGRVVAQLGVERDPSTRLALIQALGEFPDSAWPDLLRDGVRAELMGLYERDPDPGIHGSSKWLLLRWGHADDLREIDRALARSPLGPEDRRWRVDPLGLTLVTIDDPNLGRVLEVSDSEVTIELFRKFNQLPDGAVYCNPLSHVVIELFRKLQERRADVDGRLPAPASYNDAAGFCNWLSERSGIPPEQWCYGPRPGVPSRLASVEDFRDRTGFRLPEPDEFLIASRSGAETRFAFGDFSDLLGHYAWSLENSNGTSQWAYGLKPNEFGLFDTLGNLREWCEMLPWEPAPSNQGLLGFAYRSSRQSFDLSNYPPRKDAAVNIGFAYDGFRVVRTIRSKGGDEPEASGVSRSIRVRPQ